MVVVKDFEATDQRLGKIKHNIKYYYLSILLIFQLLIYTINLNL